MPPEPWSFQDDSGCLCDVHNRVLAYQVNPKIGPRLIVLPGALRVCKHIVDRQDCSTAGVAPNILWSQVVSEARSVIASSFPKPTEPPKSLEQRLAEAVLRLHQGHYRDKEDEALIEECRAKGVLK